MARIIKNAKACCLCRTATFRVGVLREYPLPSDTLIAELPPGSEFTVHDSLEGRISLRYEVDGLKAVPIFALNDEELSFFDKKDIFAILVLGDFH